MIKPSNYYAIVEKATNLVAAKGTKKAMLQIIKANRGVYQLAITSRPVGAKFTNKPFDQIVVFIN
jgi:hypothetical protein